MNAGLPSEGIGGLQPTGMNSKKFCLNVLLLVFLNKGRSNSFLRSNWEFVDFKKFIRDTGIQ